MPRISVLIPTHEHATTLPYAVRSVQAQGIDDLEILICGDGVSNELRAAITELQQTDPRIRFFDLPKAPNIGELNRDHVMRHASGQIVCIQNDDDLWLPGHVEMLERALEDADFVGAMQVNVGTDGKVRAHYFDLERPEFVEPWLEWKPNNLGSWACNGFGPIFVAHRLDAYLRLPEGWATTPVGLPTDQVMWHKFLRQPWCRAKFLRWPIALHFASSDRRDWTPARRADELRHWTEIIESSDYAAHIWRDVLPDLGDRLLLQSLSDLELPRETVASHEAPHERAALEAKAFIARIRELDAEVANVREVAAAQIANAQMASNEATQRAAAEAKAFIARIRELEVEAANVREAAATQIANFQIVFDATRVAATKRIRELENQVGATMAAAATQVADLQNIANAERSAANNRIRELESALIAHESALTSTERKSGAEFQRDAMLSSTSWRITEPLRRVVDRLRRLGS